VLDGLLELDVLDELDEFDELDGWIGTDGLWLDRMYPTETPINNTSTMVTAIIQALFISFTYKLTGQVFRLSVKNMTFAVAKIDLKLIIHVVFSSVLIQESHV
jgi:hypothetical protein